MNAIVTPVESGWSASLELEFATRKVSNGTKTALTRNLHQGPLRVLRPFYPEASGQCHVYLMHPPGGIVAGDTLAIQAQVHGGAHALITTPSAGRVYRSNSQRLQQTQRVNLQVASDGFCEWLPQENIIFNDARAVSQTRVNLDPGSTFIGWEMTCLGRPASNEWFEEGSLHQQFELYCDGQPLLLERNRFDGGSNLLHAPWGLNGATTTGTLMCVVQALHGKTLQAALIDSLRERCVAASGQQLNAAVTVVSGILIVRATGGQAEPVRRLFIDLWRALRHHLLGQAAVAPRIWFT